MKSDTRFDEIRLEVYSDEVFTIKDPVEKSEWMYLAALFIPVDNKQNILSHLNTARCKKHRDWTDFEVDCTHPCGYHSKNDTEVHYKEAKRRNRKFEIGLEWIKFIRDTAPHDSDLNLYMNIMGLNLSNMDFDAFRSDIRDKPELNIYNRFYRAVLLGGMNYFFKNYETVVIDHIYHDSGSQEKHEYFPWHPIHSIHANSNKIEICNDCIEFIDSDHKKSKQVESHFIQLIDIILGATKVCFHNDAEKYEKRKIGYEYKPIMEILLNNKQLDSGKWVGPYYSSLYYRKYSISFFPKKCINKFEAVKSLDGNSRSIHERDNMFFRNRPVYVTDPEQKNLFDF